jgi:hypothetical protein
VREPRRGSEPLKRGVLSVLQKAPLAKKKREKRPAGKGKERDTGKGEVDGGGVPSDGSCPGVVTGNGYFELGHGWLRHFESQVGDAV